MSGPAKKQGATLLAGALPQQCRWDRNAHPIDSHDREARQS